MKNYHSYEQSSRSLRAAYAVRNRPRAQAYPQPRKASDNPILGGVSFGAMLLGLILLLLV